MNADDKLEIGSMAVVGIVASILAFTLGDLSSEDKIFLGIMLFGSILYLFYIGVLCKLLKWLIVLGVFIGAVALIFNYPLASIAILLALILLKI